MLKTSEIGRHAICLDVLKSREVYEIIDSSTCDQMFKKAPTINPKKSWVLRCGKKGDRGAPVYAYTVKSKYEGKNLRSRGHAKVLRKFGVKTRLKRPFGPIGVELEEYYTTKKQV